MSDPVLERYIDVLSLMRLFGRCAVVFLVFSWACLEQVVVSRDVLESMAQDIFAVRLRTSCPNAVSSS